MKTNLFPKMKILLALLLLPGFLFSQTITWSGAVSTDLTNPGNWYGGIVPSNTQAVLIPAGCPHYPEVNNPSAAPFQCMNLTINSGATMKVLNGGCMDIKQNLVINGTFTAESGSSIIVLGDITGTMSIYRNITGQNKYHLISSPISDANIGNTFQPALQNCIWISEYEESTGAWNYLSKDNNMETGKGYSFYMECNDATAYFSGTPFNEDLNNIALSAEGTDENLKYWNLLGNPFISGIKWKLDAWNITGLTTWAYVYDGAAGNYKANPGPALPGLGTFDGIIPAQQGFWVRIENPAEYSISIPKNSRMHGGDFYKNASANDVLTIKVSSEMNQYFDVAQVAIIPEASNEYDSDYDAYKLTGNENAPFIYTLASDKRLTINSLNHLPVEKEMVLYFNSAIAGVYKFDFSGVNSFQSNTPLYLYDRIANQYIDLRTNNSYSFSHSAGAEDGRFVLMFKSVLGIQDIEQPGILTVNIDGGIKILPVQNTKSVVRIFETTGKCVYEQEFKGMEGCEILLKKGVYLVQITNNNSIISRKVIIN